MNLSSVDLNLLVAFDILIREQNLSHAAEKLDLTQPAMSKRLARLQLLFRDELLTRTNKGMKPTARALELVEPIRIAFRQFDNQAVELFLQYAALNRMIQICKPQSYIVAS